VPWVWGGAGKQEVDLRARPNGRLDRRMLRAPAGRHVVEEPGCHRQHRVRLKAPHEKRLQVRF